MTAREQLLTWAAILITFLGLALLAGFILVFVGLVVAHVVRDLIRGVRRLKTRREATDV